MSTDTSVNKKDEDVINPFKRIKLTSNDPTQKLPLIATHSGTFQADEALGVWLLRQTQAYRHSPIIRTRNPEEYNKADIVIDVGGIYDHSKKLYDHHQRDYNEKFTPRDSQEAKREERCTKLSASGLVYRHYGKEIISNYYPNLPSKDLDKVYMKMYNRFLEAIDAVDTGVEPLSDDALEKGVDLLYRDATGLSTRVGRLNPRWNEEGEIDIDKRFEEASQMCGDEFLSILIPMVESELPARSIVEQALLDRKGVDASGEIMKFPNGGLPWKKHLYDLEEEQKLSDDDKEGGGRLIKFVLYTDQGGMWRVQAVTVKGQAFENRLGLPEKWRGVRDEDLTKIAGIPGCKFCHAAGFIGGNETFEGALKMAQAALEEGKTK